MSGAVGLLRSSSGDLPGLRPSSTLASRDVGGFRTGVAKREGRSQSGDHPAAPGGEWPADPLYRGISEQRPGKWVRPVPACVTQKSHLFGYHRRCQPNQCFKSNGIVFQLAVVRSNWMWSISYEMDFCQLNCLECEWNLCGSSKNVKMWRKLLT